MTTTITLEDGRVLGTTNGEFDALIELVTAELERQPGALPGLQAWLLDQRCAVQGPGVGYLDLRELSPPALQQFKAGFAAGLRKESLPETPGELQANCALLTRMWESIHRGEPPEALTSPHWKVSPWDGKRRGPGWP